MMKHKILCAALLFCLLFSIDGMAQKKEKIKGNGNVITKQTNVNAFHTIVLDEDFEVEMFSNSNPSIEVEADENLHDVIEFNVKDSVLTFYKNKRITSKKKLNITVKYDESLKQIETLGDSELHSMTTLDVPELSLKTLGFSKAYLTVKANNFRMLGSGKSKVKLNLTAQNAKIELNENGYLIALINTEIFAADLYQRADAVIEGNCNEATIRTDNSSQFKGKDFTINNCKVLSEINSDAYLEALNTVTINASGSSAIYLYGNPKITVDNLSDIAKIEKKAK